jgi:cation:H+ antiporter
MPIDTALIFLSLALLFYGGDFLVTGSINLSKRFKVSPFFIGAVIIGFGTSAPEFAVSIMASLNGSGDLALANIIGSNITNVGLVLGTTALISPLTIESRQFNKETPALIIATFLICVFAWNNYLSRLEGIIMIILLFFYLLKSFKSNEQISNNIEENSSFLDTKRPPFQFFLTIVGIVMLIIGANLMVQGATSIARSIGISEWFIGVSIVALGTSLPEIVSSVIAAKRGHGDMAIGNIFGSNIFNILMVIGVASSIHPIAINASIHADLLYTTSLTCLLLFLLGIRHTIKKRDGIILILCYAVYICLKALNFL